MPGSPGAIARGGTRRHRPAASEAGDCGKRSRWPPGRHIPAGSVSSTLACFCTQRSRQVVTTRSNAAERTQCSSVIPSGRPYTNTSKPAPSPRRGDLRHLLDGELDRRDDAARAEPEDLRGGVLVEAVHGIVGHHVAAITRELGDQSEVSAHDRGAEGEPLVERPPLSGTHDGRGAEAQRLAGGGELLDQRLDPRGGRGGVSEEHVEGDLVGVRRPRRGPGRERRPRQRGSGRRLRIRIACRSSELLAMTGRLLPRRSRLRDPAMRRASAVARNSAAASPQAGGAR